MLVKLHQQARKFVRLHHPPYTELQISCDLDVQGLLDTLCHTYTYRIIYQRTRVHSCHMCVSTIVKQYLHAHCHATFPTSIFRLRRFFEFEIPFPHLLLAPFKTPF
eukprot:m.62110 g.62110  ORF g.62110 m.62110 type:complete len:106 (+) comp23088_c0_seq1:737-1054(+)